MKDSKFKVLDLFSGCGGISVGFDLTKRCDIVGAVDFDRAACNTFKFNFKKAKVLCCDIKKLSVSHSGFERIDILVGGPPCQGFSSLNRKAKNNVDDPRNKLFLQFIRFVKELMPKAIMIENVRQILTQKEGYAKNKICKMLNELGYNVSYSILNSSDFGVPQNRKRAVFVGIRKDIGSFDFENLNKKKIKTKTTVGEALEDLFSIENKKIKADTHKIKKSITNRYLKLMHDNSGVIHNHLMKYPNKICQRRIGFVREGHNWKDVPENLFPSKRNNRHSNYLKRLDRKSQSITVDTGHDVYYHPIFNRVPTVRETARIQSFPDKFIFTGSRTEQLRQVGNAVPPLMAKAIALCIIGVINDKK